MNDWLTLAIYFIFMLIFYKVGYKRGYGDGIIKGHELGMTHGRKLYHTLEETANKGVG